MRDLPRFYVIADAGLAKKHGRELETVAEAVSSAENTMYQLRAKEASAGQVTEIATSICSARPADSPILINDRADVAMIAGADGVHLPANGLPVGACRALLGAKATVGVSTHDREQLIAAERSRADFATLSPVFPSPSKPGYGPPLGLGRLHELTAAVELPVYALGGLTPSRVAPCIEAGAYGVASMGAVMRAEDVRTKLSTFLAHLPEP